MLLLLVGFVAGGVCLLAISLKNRFDYDEQFGTLSGATIDSYWAMAALVVVAGVGNAVFHPADYVDPRGAEHVPAARGVPAGCSRATGSRRRWRTATSAGGTAAPCRARRRPASAQQLAQQGPQIGALDGTALRQLAVGRQAVDQAAGQLGDGESVIKLILSRGVEHGPTPTAWVLTRPSHTNAEAYSATPMMADTVTAMVAVGSARKAKWLVRRALTAVNGAAMVIVARSLGSSSSAFTIGLRARSASS